MPRLSPISPFLALGVVLASSPAFAQVQEHWVWTYPLPALVNSVQALPNGNVLISDKSGSRIIEVTPTLPSGGPLAWSFNGLNQPDQGRRLANGDTLIADTSSQRIVRVSSAGVILKTFGDGAARCAPTSFFYPGDAFLTADGNYLIADASNSRLLLLDDAGLIQWEYGDNAGCVSSALMEPFDAEELADGSILVTDAGLNVVIRLAPASPSSATIIWQYGTTGVAGGGANQLNVPTRSHLLANGNVLIADSNNHRVIEVTPTLPSGGTIVWQHGTTGTSGNGHVLLNGPYDAARMTNDDTLIADHYNSRVIEISPLRAQLPSLSLNAGICSDPQQVTLQDAYTPDATASPLRVDLGTSDPSSIAFYADAQCQVPLDHVDIAAGGTTGSFFVMATSGGNYSLISNAPTYIQNQSSVRVVQAAQLVFLQAPRLVQSGSCSAQAFQLALTDTSGQPAEVQGPLQITIVSDSSRTQLFGDPNCLAPLGSVAFAKATNQQIFYVHDQGIGMRTIQASAPGFAGATTQYLVSEPLNVGCSCGALPGSTASLLALLAWLGGLFRPRTRA